MDNVQEPSASPPNLGVQSPSYPTTDNLENPHPGDFQHPSSAGPLPSKVWNQTLFTYKWGNIYL